MLATLYATDFFTMIGIIGAITYVSNYTLLSFGAHTSDSARYYALNIVAASSVIVSLAGQFNLPSLLIQGFYLGMSILALAVRLNMMRLRRPPGPPQAHRIIHLRRTQSWSQSRRHHAHRRRKVR